MAHDGCRRQVPQLHTWRRRLRGGPILLGSRRRQAARLCQSYLYGHRRKGRRERREAHPRHGRIHIAFLRGRRLGGKLRRCFGPRRRRPLSDIPLRSDRRLRRAQGLRSPDEQQKACAVGRTRHIQDTDVAGGARCPREHSARTLHITAYMVPRDRVLLSDNSSGPFLRLKGRIQRREPQPQRRRHLLSLGRQFPHIHRCRSRHIYPPDIQQRALFHLVDAERLA